MHLGRAQSEYRTGQDSETRLLHLEIGNLKQARQQGGLNPLPVGLDRYTQVGGEESKGNLASLVALRGGVFGEFTE